jgi:hypothetical protein
MQQVYVFHLLNLLPGSKKIHLIRQSVVITAPDSRDEIQGLKEALNILLNLVRYRTSNFGLSTVILMHIVHHTCHSPIGKAKYLLDTLRDVCFQEIMSDYTRSP